MASLLIIDETESDRSRYAAALRAMGHEVAAAQAPPDDALSAAGAVHAVVLSSSLPGEGGVSLLRRLRAGETTALTPVLLVCPEGRPDHIVEGIRAGADDILVRPVDAVAITRAVSFLLLTAEVRRRVREERDRERRQRDIESFVFLVSHDLKTPVVSIQGLTSILLGEGAPPLPEKAREYVTRIRANVERIDELVRDLLDFPRIRSLVNPPEPVYTREILEKATEALREKIETHRAEVVLPDALPLIQCDRRRIQQVFHNLIENAIKYTPDDRTPRIEISYRDDGTAHEFSVRDNGEGIRPEDQERAFHLYERLSTSRTTEGMGIGLAVTRQIVERHGGRIWCESELGRGTTFRFTLPKSGPPSHPRNSDSSVT